MNPDLPAASISSIHRWLDLWNTPDLAARTTIEYSPRLTRSLGRCYPERHLIRLAAFLDAGLDEADNGLIEEVLCHELAHVAVYELHGASNKRGIRPHGPEWKALMRAAGFEPRTRMPTPANAPKPRPNRHLYLHRCPVCQRSRTARRSMRRWRCRACLDAGARRCSHRHAIPIVSESLCPFCEPDPERVFYRGDAVCALWDAFPVSDGHALIIAKRHVETWFDASREEQTELLSALAVAKEAISSKHRPDGFNIGVNVGETAGQTVPHLHVHLIPRYQNDVEDPRGGVRHVIPSRADYLKPSASTQTDRAADAGPLPLESAPSISDTSPLVTGGDDPLLPYLLSHLDQARHADILASFVLESGVEALEDHVRDLLDRGGHLRLLAGDYLGITEPNALLRLLDLQQGTRGTFDVRAFESENKSFHPKAYIFHGRYEPFGRGVAYVGSSNLSRSALTDAIEWNYRIVPAGANTAQHEGFTAIVRAFDQLFEHPRAVPLTPEWIERYRARRPKQRLPPVDVPLEPSREIPEPHDIQRKALEALEQTRADGNAAGLVVLATGLGKTWLAAFDTVRFGAKRVLFVAHREEILRQALDTFRTIRPGATLGLYTGDEKTPTADVLFASIQTLGKAAHLRSFTSNAFDYNINY